MHQIGALTIADSYHCSRYNTNTGRLTTVMLDAVFTEIRRRIPVA
jgi:uracil-DNA glycosylase